MDEFYAVVNSVVCHIMQSIGQHFRVILLCSRDTDRHTLAILNGLLTLVSVKHHLMLLFFSIFALSNTVCLDNLAQHLT